VLKRAFASAFRARLGVFKGSILHNLCCKEEAGLKKIFGTNNLLLLGRLLLGSTEATSAATTYPVVQILVFEGTALILLLTLIILMAS
jgi:hypothetical protein